MLLPFRGSQSIVYSTTSMCVHRVWHEVYPINHTTTLSVTSRVQSANSNTVAVFLAIHNTGQVSGLNTLEASSCLQALLVWPSQCAIPERFQYGHDTETLGPRLFGIDQQPNC